MPAPFTPTGRCSAVVVTAKGSLHRPQGHSPRSAREVPILAASAPEGTAECWGDNGNERATPPPGELFQSISSGFAHVCGLRPDGTAACWGGKWDRSDLGEAASPPGWSVRRDQFRGMAYLRAQAKRRGNREGQSSPPPGGFTSISSGRAHSCGLREDGTAECWGAGSPNNTKAYNHDQDLPPEGEKFLSISAGDDHTCGLRADGNPLCWGYNEFGQASPKR